jgi:CubicO group peptidase (beta-lactamase class C family)
MTQLEEKLNRLIKENISARLFPACAIGVISNGRRIAAHGGTLTYESPKALEVDSLFDVASLTKAIPTSCLALKLIEENRLGLNDEIGKYLPECANPTGDKVTVWNLLTQTVYYDYGFRLSSLRHKSRQEILGVIFSTAARTSKTEVTYTNSSSILLGLIIESIYGKSLAEAGEEVFFKPLGMARTTFKPLKIAGRTDIVPTEINDSRGGLIQGEIHDESAHFLQPNPVGTAGLFSTVPDMLNFMEVLLNKGQLNGRRYFSEATIKQMQTNQLAGTDHSTGLGWELNQPRFMGRFAPHSFGKTGFTGCVFVCSPQLQAGFVILSNHVYPKRPPDYSLINQFRVSVADEVFAAALNPPQA